MIADDEPMEILELEENLADAEKPKEIPAGKYLAEIQSVEKATSGKGNSYFAIQFRIPPDELPADIAEQYEEGAVLFYNRVMVPKGRADARSLFNLKKFVQALGLDTNITTIDPNEWMGRPARLIVKNGRYQGEDRAEISAVEAAEPVAAPSRAKPSAAKPKGRSKAA